MEARRRRRVLLATIAVAAALTLTPAVANDRCPEFARIFGPLNHDSYQVELNRCEAEAFESGAAEAGREIQQNKL
jgi:hypothetical protein